MRPPTSPSPDLDPAEYVGSDNRWMLPLAAFAAGVIILSAVVLS